MSTTGRSSAVGSVWIAGSYQSDFARNVAREGLDNQHLHAIAELNMANAKDNPLAQTRSWSHRPGGFADDDHDNPRED